VFILASYISGANHYGRGDSIKARKAEYWGPKGRKSRPERAEAGWDFWGGAASLLPTS